MGFYLRKSIRLGPVRLNLSKSGLGLSLGVKGLRYGIRPNGKSYVHAGRYGVYYRKELGGLTRPTAPPDQPRDVEPGNPPVGPTEVYGTADAARLSQLAATKLVDLLRRAYGKPRIDYPMVALCVIGSMGAIVIHPVLGGFVTALGVLFAWAAVRWETARRSVYVQYPLDDEAMGLFRRLLDAFNHLASCSRVWTMRSSTALTNIHEMKRHAGASSLVGRTDARAGESSPPWAEVNLPVPAIGAGQQTLYFLPDGILVYDSTGVAQVPYAQVKVTAGSTRFIEDFAPNDATVVGRTWSHPNKDGGPDRRFANNRQIPICVYGELVLQSTGGLFLYLQTSRSDAAEQFRAAIDGFVQPGLRATGPSDVPAVQPSVEVNREFFDTFPAFARSAIGSLTVPALRSAQRAVVAACKWFDRGLGRLAGEGNDLLHYFLRILSMGLGLVALVGMFYGLMRAFCK
jgi:hypothetical protein